MVLDIILGIVDQFLAIFETIPEGIIAIAVYGLGSLLVLWCWYGVVRRLPYPIGALLWITIFAILLTPTVSAGDNASLAPAIFGLIFGVLTKDMYLMWTNLMLILLVMGLGCLVGFCWSKYMAKKDSVSEL